MIHPISATDLLALPHPIPIADVRTPAEYQHGHIPGACNLPIFSNEERVQVGTTYKQAGKESAILLGFDLTGNKWSGFIRQALEIAPGKKIAVHCWRGGMRSGAMAWALNLYGFEVYVIQGGYKSYRRWALQQFERRYRLRVLGGMTGSGKTMLLQQLPAAGEQIIDLEALAQHQGSAYGSLNKLVQPTQEQFENNLAQQLSALKSNNSIWVEDESISIGKRYVPKPFWDQMQEAALLNLETPTSQRIQNLLAEYGTLDKEFLVTSTERIRKRLGPEQTKMAIAAIRDDRMEEFIQLVLAYYDKTYRNGMAKRSVSSIIPVPLNGTDIAQQVATVLQFEKQIAEPLINTTEQ